MRRLLILSVLLLALAATGCRSCDRVESALRQRETDLRETREELEKTGAYTQALEQELRCIRGEPAGGVLPPNGEPPTLAYPLKSLTLGRQTGGFDAGGSGCDE